MSNNFIIAQFFGILGLIFSVLAMQMKTKKNIMIMFLGLNIASALNFLFLGSYSATYIYFFAVIEIFINYLFEKKNKTIPLYLVIIYIIINITLGIIVYTVPLDLIPIICSILFCLSICAKKESSIRKIVLGNLALWLVYDIAVKAYAYSISDILTTISTIISIYRYDYKPHKDKKKNNNI